MVDYDKRKIREQITNEQVFDLLEEFGGEPQYMADAIISRTVCHNGFGEVIVILIIIAHGDLT